MDYKTHVHGRLLKVQLGDDYGDIESLAQEKTSVITIEKAMVKGAGATARDGKIFEGLRSWRMSSEMLLDITMLGRLVLMMQDGAIGTMMFGGALWYYGGKVFPTSIKVVGNVGSLVKVSVEWQGTGRLVNFSLNVESLEEIDLDSFS